MTLLARWQSSLAMGMVVTMCSCLMSSEQGSDATDHGPYVVRGTPEFTKALRPMVLWLLLGNDVV